MPIALFELVKEFGFIGCASLETRKPKPTDNVNRKKKARTIKKKSATVSK